MNDLPHPGWRAIHCLSDGPIPHTAGRKQNDPGVAAVDGVTPFTFQAMELDPFIRAKAADFNGILHNTPPGKKPWGNEPPKVFYANPTASAARHLTYTPALAYLKRKLPAENGSTI